MANSAIKNMGFIGAGAARRKPADAANGSDAILLCLSDATAIEAALFSEDGAMHSAIPELGM
jgi:3-hydroxyisobutyrate dehydrogenase-like beta-hydroxyacid dehydrogenase